MVKEKKLKMLDDIMEKVEEVSRLRATLTHARRNAKANEINGDEALQENLDKRVDEIESSHLESLGGLEKMIWKAMGLKE